MVFHLIYFIHNIFITAFSTRSQIKENSSELLPHDIITYSTTHPLLKSKSIENLPIHFDIKKMADQTLLAKARKARFDDLPNFSGHPSEDVERFLKSIKKLTKATDETNDHEILEIVRGKLTKSAGIWFDNNESIFKKWLDFETAFRNRYFSTMMINKKFDQLKQRKQKHDEPITSYYDDIVNLCQEIDPNMSEQIIIQHLMSGMNPEFKKELSRRESAMNTLKEFLKYAKIEQDLYDTIKKSDELSLESSQPRYNGNNASTATIKQPKQHYHVMKQNTRFTNPVQSQSSVLKRNSIPQRTYQPLMLREQPIRNFQRQSMIKNKMIHNQATTQHQFSNCKVCGRRNHRTIDCFHKRTTGCFNCGQNHNIRDCTLPPNFQ